MGSASDDRTADEVISQERKASIRREFPAELLDKTPPEIEALARTGNATARKAHKLLRDSRFRKQSE